MDPLSDEQFAIKLSTMTPAELAVVLQRNTAAQSLDDKKEAINQALRGLARETNVPRRLQSAAEDMDKQSRADAKLRNEGKN